MGLTGKEIGALVVGGASTAAGAYSASRLGGLQQEAIRRAQQISAEQVRLAGEALELEQAEKSPNQALLREMGGYAYGLAKTAPEAALAETREQFKNLVREDLSTIDRATELELRQVDQDARTAAQQLADAVPRSDGRYARMLADIAMEAQDKKQAVVAKATQAKVSRETEIRNQYLANAVAYAQNIPTQRAQLVGTGVQALSAQPYTNYLGYSGAVGGAYAPISDVLRTATEERLGLLQNQAALQSALGGFTEGIGEETQPPFQVIIQQPTGTEPMSKSKKKTYIPEAPF